MDDSGDGSTGTVVDAGHSPCKRTGGRYSAEERGDDVGDALAYELGVGVVLLTGDTVCDHCGKQGLDGAEYGYGEGRGHEALHGLEVHFRGHGFRHREALGKFGELGAYGGEFHPGEPGQEHCCRRACDERDERARDFAEAPLVPKDDQEEAAHAEGGFRPGDVAQVLEIAYPFRDEAGRYGNVTQAEEVLHLGGEDGQGYTAGEAHHDRVRDELEHGAHLAQAHCNQNHSGHNGGEGKAGHAVLRHDARHDYDERAGRAADEEAGASEDGDEETGNYCRNKSLLRGHAARYTEGDGEREGDDADNDAGDKVGDKTLTAVSALLE